MTEEALRKHALECLRLRAECMELAGQAATPELQRHFLAQAEVWAELAEQGPDGTVYTIAPPDSGSPD